MPKRCFYGFSDDFSFLLFLWAESGKPCMTARSDTSGQTDKAILPCRWFAQFHATGYALFVGGYFFHGFLFWSFLSNLPLLPFTSIFAPFSEPHQTVIFVLGVKVTPGFDGKARPSLLSSGKISSPAGSIFPKNLAFPNPYLSKHPKRKRLDPNKSNLK